MLLLQLLLLQLIKDLGNHQAFLQVSLRLYLNSLKVNLKEEIILNVQVKLTVETTKLVVRFLDDQVVPVLVRQLGNQRQTGEGLDKG
jgi:hypothetical protein